RILHDHRAPEVGRIAPPTRCPEGALDDDHTEELEPARHVEVAVDQQDTLPLLAVDGGAATGDADDREILAARSGRIARAPPVGEHGPVARAARYHWRDAVGKVLRRQCDIGLAGERSEEHTSELQSR